MHYWIFQANPAFYDLPGALGQLKEQTWRVSGYRTQIHVDDVVFMWESGVDAGILGTATVSCEPKGMAASEVEKPFVRNAAEFADIETRVVLSIDKVLESRIRKTDLLKDDVLRNLAIITNARGTNFAVTTEQARRLKQMIGPTNDNEGSIPVVPMLSDDSRFETISDATFLPAHFFRDLEKLLSTKQQVILQGAPGTGKTFVAKELAKWWAGDAHNVKIVQFHESYGYEDFVEGFKPKNDPDGAGPQFVLTPGPFWHVCQLAKSVPDQKPVVLIIDEINRAKTSRVFGELLYLLEYRKEEITLQTGKSFSIPTNLFVLAARGESRQFGFVS